MRSLLDGSPDHKEIKSIFNSKEMLFKHISIFSSGMPFCSAVWNHLCNFSKGHLILNEHFCENILNIS